VKRSAWVVFRLQVEDTADVHLGPGRVVEAPIRRDGGVIGSLYVYGSRAEAVAAANGARVEQIEWDTNEPNRKHKEPAP